MAAKDVVEDSDDNISECTTSSSPSSWSFFSASGRTRRMAANLRSGISNGMQAIGTALGRKDPNEAWERNWQALTEGKDMDSVDEDMLWVCERWRRAAKGERHRLRHKIASPFRTGGDPRHNRLTAAIRRGIPPPLRDPLWYACSGGATKQRQSQRSYEDYLASGRKLAGSEAVHVLEADIPRTGLEPPEQEALRDLLLAWVEHSPSIGYCQSMNFIGAALLSCLSPERAFWTFSSLIEDVLPEGYYTTSLAGLRVDLKVLEILIGQYFPRLRKHLGGINLELFPITMNWFLCLFVNTLPALESYRILDCLMHEGSKVLFRASLTLLRMRESELLQVNNLVEAYELLRAPLGTNGLTVALDNSNLPAGGTLPQQDIVKGMYAHWWTRGLSTDTLLQLRAEQALVVKAEDAERADMSSSPSERMPQPASPSAGLEELQQRRRTFLEDCNLRSYSSFMIDSALRQVSPDEAMREVRTWISFVGDKGENEPSPRGR